MAKRYIASFVLWAVACAAPLCAETTQPRYRAPSILLNSPFHGLPITTPQLFLSGSVMAATTVVAVEVDGVGAALDAQHNWHLMLDTTLDTTPGTRQITITARDAHDAVGELVLDVRIDPPAHLPEADRPRLAVLPWENEDASSAIPALFHTTLHAAIFQTEAFQLVHRDALAEVLREAQIEQADLAAAESRLRIGQLLVADLLLASTVHHHADGLLVTPALIDVPTGKVLWTAVYGSMGLEAPFVEQLAQGVALDLQRRLAVLQAVVVDASAWPQADIDLGTQAGVREGLKVVADTGAEGRVTLALRELARVTFDGPDEPLPTGQPVRVIGALPPLE